MSPVIVGVDDSEASLRAVEWAAGEAVRRRLPLEIVHGFYWPRLGVPLGPALGAPVGQGGLRHAAERILATALDRAQAVAPGLDVTTRMMEHAPASALLQRSHHAEVLVVGSRGLGKIGGLLLESVGAELAARTANVVTFAHVSVGTTDSPRSRSPERNSPVAPARHWCAPRIRRRCLWSVPTTIPRSAR
ncbi:nucleotide-binding universal stress UspA family protein [Nonomuraea rubra]|uniref:Nucleotide-binding universal stress UspA family protein n=1 Tax=Nonomuraea rubra TaxID=46180 RepID=A0A7X0U015_9ACTN|nr:universal stress protein [Nonomuraea rubra]MBB6550156.1 nucleotide-binding universal stress UspA family protein [Nonomuraea rubra]